MSPVQSRSGRASHLDGPASDRPGGHIYVTFERDVTAARTWPARVPAVTSRVNGRTSARERAPWSLGLGRYALTHCVVGLDRSAHSSMHVVRDVTDATSGAPSRTPPPSTAPPQLKSRAHHVNRTIWYDHVAQPRLKSWRRHNSRGVDANPLSFHPSSLSRLPLLLQPCFTHSSPFPSPLFFSP